MYVLVFMRSTEDSNILTYPCLGILALVFTEDSNNMASHISRNGCLMNRIALKTF